MKIVQKSHHKSHIHIHDVSVCLEALDCYSISCKYDFTLGTPAVKNAALSSSGLNDVQVKHIALWDGCHVYCVVILAFSAGFIGRRAASVSLSLSGLEPFISNGPWTDSLLLVLIRNHSQQIWADPAGLSAARQRPGGYQRADDLSVCGYFCIFWQKLIYYVLFAMNFSFFVFFQAMVFNAADDVVDFLLVTDKLFQSF